MVNNAIQKIIKEYLRNVERPGIKHLNADFPFLFTQKKAYLQICEALFELVSKEKVDYVAAIEAVGLPMGGYLAHALQAGFIMIRKENLLGGSVLKSRSFLIPYRKKKIRLEIQKDIPLKNKYVVLFDEGTDTGATIKEAVVLLTKAGAIISSVITITNYANLKKVKGTLIKSLIYGAF